MNWIFFVFNIELVLSNPKKTLLLPQTSHMAHLASPDLTQSWCSVMKDEVHQRPKGQRLPEFRNSYPVGPVHISLPLHLKFN
jgi:hypothetical protein